MKKYPNKFKMKFLVFVRSLLVANSSTLRSSAFLLFAVLLCINFISVLCAPCMPNTMVITRQPGDGFGGDPLLTQPIITQLNSSNQPCITDSSSKVYIEIKENPAVFAKIESYNTSPVIWS